MNNFPNVMILKEVCTVWVEIRFTPRKLLIIFKIIYEQWISIHLMKESFILSHLVSCMVCVHVWMNRGHCLRECKNRLAPKLRMWCSNKTIGIWVLIRSLQIKKTSLPNLIMPHISNIKYQRTFLRARVCDFAYAKRICNAFHLIHSIHSLTPLILT